MSYSGNPAPHTRCNGNELREEKLLNALAVAEQAAKKSLRATKAHRDLLLSVIKDFEIHVEASEINVPSGKSEIIESAIKSFQLEYDKLRSMLDGLAERSTESLTRAYENLEKDVRFVTIMLFGRTRAGKSTTMEALTGGDGTSIGKGKQHTTTEVKAYYFPALSSDSEPNYPCLRIVDTPGIEGFEGESLAAMAEEFVERSDHIFFLLTDDKATSGELERFGFIRTQGKGITVLLNVKASDDDLDLLISAPNYVFKDDELDGHKRRISGYLRRHFDMPPPEVIPFHARSAWLSRSPHNLPDSVTSHKELEVASRINDVEEHILQYILNEAFYARIRTPRDLLNSYVWSLKDELRPFAGRFKKMMANLAESTNHLERGVERARKRIVNRYPLLRARFQSASDGVPGLVDEIISAGGFGRVLSKKWGDYLQAQGVSDSVRWFVETGQKDLESEINEEVRVAAIDFNASDVDDLTGLFDEYHEKEESAKENKYARAALRTGAGTGAAALTGWAIANWWNPTGWAAAGAALVVAAVGIGAEAVARKATDEWAQANKRDLYSHRSELIKNLRDHLWADYRLARERCGNWLDQAKALYIETAKETALPVQTAAKSLWSATVATLNALDDVASNSDHELISEIFCSVVPDISSGRVTVKKVARYPKVVTKVLLNTDYEHISVLGTCIGTKGSRIRKVVSALGGETVHLVDAKTNLSEMILQALGLSNIDSNVITLDAHENSTIAWIKAPRQLVGQIIGTGGSNIRLASQLLGIKIQIQEA
ncbi:50S ribosome-binding GTPase [Microbulbifer thermotolerans]|uniref:GTPase n=1 Tax=Microbulbifer thermotolerans TaxID=252514 RepID=UPI002671E5B7|nr:GTPase [Microbulbifer thermotolerans]WKT61289.1 50S ribosome-binding GTPase [Microbulbifer thermotolerans]